MLNRHSFLLTHRFSVSLHLDFIVWAQVTHVCLHHKAV